jgi:DNA repair exonuclease SbcCD ATPase subunit
MSDETSDPSPDWRLNYFNYFTEVEEQFQRARGTSLFLLSPLDWALIEDWKNSGVPLEAVLRGIAAAFDKWRGRQQKYQQVNSLAFCAQAVLKEAQAMADHRPSPAETAGAPFPLESLRAHLERAIAALTARDGFAELASSLQALLDHVESHFANLQELDQRLTAIEEKMAALARTRLSDEQLFQMRKAMDAQLRPYRGKMTTDQLQRLEKSMMDRRIYEDLALPRLSIFYIS